MTEPVTKPSNRDLREVAIRSLISNVVGPKWAPLADAGMTLLGNDAGEVYQKGKDFLGTVSKGYWEKMGEAPARHAYGRLTEKANPKQMAGSVQSGRQRPVDPFFNPGGDALRKSTESLGKQGGLERFIHEHPEMTAEIVGTTAATAPLIAGGALLSSFAQGEKPRSAYAAPVQPDRGGYNPNVEAAQASNYYQNQILDKKHAHALELKQLREQARTPGMQDISQGQYGSGLMSSNPFGGVIGNAFGNTRVFPEDPGVTSIGLR